MSFLTPKDIGSNPNNTSIMALKTQRFQGLYAFFQISINAIRLNLFLKIKNTGIYSQNIFTKNYENQHKTIAQKDASVLLKKTAKTISSAQRVLRNAKTAFYDIRQLFPF